MHDTPDHPTHADTTRRRWLHPGQRLMRRLSLRGKLLVLLAAMVPSLTVTVIYEVADALSQIETMDAERIGAGQARRVLHVVSRLNAQRLAIAQLAPGQSDSPARQAAARELRLSLDAVDAILPGDGILAQTWQHERRLLLQLAAQLDASSRQARLAAFDERLHGLHLMLQLIGEQSKLMLDPHISTYLLADTGLTYAVPWTATVSQLHGAGLMLAQGNGATPDHGRVQAAAERLRQASEQLNWRQQALARHGTMPPSSAESMNATWRVLADRADALLVAPSDAAAVRAFDEAALQTGSALARWVDDGWSLFDSRLQQRRRAAWNTAALLVGSLAVGALLMGYFALAFAMTMRESLQQLRLGVQRVAAGNLLQPVSVPGRDELAQLGLALEGMMVRLSSMVGEIRSSAVRVDEAGALVAGDGRALATRSNDQSQMLRQAQHALTDIGAVVHRHEASAAALNELSATLRGNAERGNASMDDTTQAMTQLVDSVRRVAEVNAVIDDLAFQTNMLALNASVEASRAGESGKGFAVVASEIRQLAHRCAEAAAEVRQLIEATTEQTALSKLRLDDARAQLRSIGEGVRDVAQRMQDVTDGGRRQRERVDELGALVEQLGALTRSHVEAAHKASRAAHTMAHQATSLRGSVASTRLRRGTADEARALVERAVAHIAEAGWNHAIDSFNAAGGPFIDRDLYIFVLDAEGRYLAFGADPSLVGHHVSERRDITEGIVERFMQAAREVLPQGQGWVDYLAPDRNGHGDVSKSAYLIALDDGAFIGCGITRDTAGIEAGVAPSPETTAAG